MRSPIAALALLLARSALADPVPCAEEKAALEAVAKRREMARSGFLGKPPSDDAQRSRREYDRLNDESGVLAQKLAACEKRQREDEAARKRAERIERERVAAERAALLEARLKDRAWMAVPLSALLCQYGDERRGALGEIATEKKYARVGGVVSLGKLHGLQETVRAYDEKSAEARRRLGELKLKALPCPSPAVQAALACKAGKDGACVDETVKAHADLASAVDR